MAMKKYLGDSITLIAGAALTLAFAPYGIFTLAILSPALLFGLWLNITPRRAFYRGWLYGVGFFGTGVYWVYNSIHTYGGASFLLSSTITLGFVAILALFPALNGYLLNRFFPQPLSAKRILAFPALWVLLEWCRSWLLTGFSWLTLGDSQVQAPLKGFAPILSTYGVSFAVLLSSSLIVLTVFYCRKKQTQLAYRSIFAFILLWVIGGCLSLITWTKPLGAPIQVSLVQGNIPQELKWSDDQVQPTLNRYVALTQAHWDSKIIVWPEGAIPTTLQSAVGFLTHLKEDSEQHHSTVITGIPIQDDKTGNYYNAVIPLGDGYGIYKKHRLVPFGEFIPLPGLLKMLLIKLNIPMSDFIPGDLSPTPIVADDIKIATFICYEIAFAEQVRQSDPDIGLILTVSNDGWFGHSIASAQHLQSAAMRALEMGRPVLFVANTGLTAIIRPDGDIQSLIPPFITAVLTDKVQPYTGQTPWHRMGLDPLLIILVGILFFARRT
jgi:apolipoprotein N-acyltransferase